MHAQLFRRFFCCAFLRVSVFVFIVNQGSGGLGGWVSSSDISGVSFSSDVAGVSSLLVSSETGELLSDRCIHAFILYLPGTINSLGVGIGERCVCWSDYNLILDNDY